MAVLKAVLVGCGSISAAWLKALKDIEDVAIVGLVDLRLEAARSRKAEFGLDAAQTGEELPTMLRLTRPNLVFDCTVPQSHFAVVTTALRHGCHVLGEKPMTDSLAHARRMIATAERANRLYAVMQNRRYDQRTRAFRALISSGALGELTTLHCDFFIGPHFGGFREHMPHVLLMDMAIHTFDQARLISGTDAVSVYAVEWNPKGSWYERDASAVAVFEMSGGTVFTYRWSWCAEGLATSWRGEWRVIGTNGSAFWNGEDCFRAEVVEKRGAFLSEVREIPVAIPADNQLEGHAACIREFVACVREGRVPETICTDNIKSLAMVLGACKSARLRRRVRIPGATGVR
ncbi:MAG: Gfo/Idh/MocA family protein [Kiritimatiellia bacterium]